MAASNRTSTPEDDSSGHHEIVGFWRSRWFWAFFALEAFLFGGGYVVASFGSPATGIAAGPDPYSSMGGVMGSLGLVVGALWLLAICSSIWFRVEKYRAPEIEL